MTKEQLPKQEQGKRQAKENTTEDQESIIEEIASSLRLEGFKVTSRFVEKVINQFFKKHPKEKK